jgi:hypothetical protein
MVYGANIMYGALISGSFYFGLGFGLLLRLLAVFWLQLVGCFFCVTSGLVFSSCFWCFCFSSVVSAVPLFCFSFIWIGSLYLVEF